MNFLIFDTETTGLPLDMSLPAHHLDNWPRIVQLAWALYDEEGNPLRRSNFIIRPEGFRIPDGMIHGITHQEALEEGEHLRFALVDFAVDITEAGAIVAHNYDFDCPVVAAEFIRTFRRNPFDHAIAYCTQKQPTAHLKIVRKEKERGYGLYKWPSLKQLHQYCFGTDVPNAHDASADVDATARCFFHLRKLDPEIFELPYHS